MDDIIQIGEYQAIITYDPDTKLYRGTWALIWDGSFYADNIEDLKKEAKKSLKTYHELCARKDVLI